MLFAEHRTYNCTNHTTTYSHVHTHTLRVFVRVFELCICILHCVSAAVSRLSLVVHAGNSFFGDVRLVLYNTESKRQWCDVGVRMCACVSAYAYYYNRDRVLRACARAHCELSTRAPALTRLVRGASVELGACTMHASNIA